MSNDNPIDIMLQNYRALIARVDTHIQHIEAKYTDHIACKKGCDTCCEFLNLFPVEAMAISHAFNILPMDIKKRVIKRIETDKKKCPLLIESSCVLYQSRPVICRTHGYPIFMEDGKKRSIDFCPKNFKGMTSFPKDALLSIEQLNSMLFAVNKHFLEQLAQNLPDRLPISEAIFLMEDSDPT